VLDSQLTHRFNLQTLYRPVWGNESAAVVIMDCVTADLSQRSSHSYDQLFTGDLLQRTTTRCCNPSIALGESRPCSALSAGSTTRCRRIGRDFRKDGNRRPRMETTILPGCLEVADAGSTVGTRRARLDPTLKTAQAILRLYTMIWHESGSEKSRPWANRFGLWVKHESATILCCGRSGPDESMEKTRVAIHG